MKFLFRQNTGININHIEWFKLSESDEGKVFALEMILHSGQRVTFTYSNKSERDYDIFLITN